MLQILTGEINQTYGKAGIGGYKIPEQMQKARMLIGYCPQANPILDLLTGREHLHLFAVIKGVPKNLVD